MDNLFSIFLFLLMLLGCNNVPNSKSSNDRAAVPIDSLNMYATDLSIISIDVHFDTLKIVSSSPTIYYPYGNFSNIKELLNRYPYLKLETERQFPYKDSTMLLDTIYILSSNGNQLKLLLEPELKLLQIVSGKIINRKLPQINEVTVGMNKIDFIHTYFPKLPEGYENINVVEIESALTGIWHYYNFRRDTLNNKTYISDYQYN